MRKILIIAIMLCAVGTAGWNVIAYAQSGKSVYGVNPQNLNAYSKDYIISVPCTAYSDTLDSLATAYGGWKFSKRCAFLVPEAAEAVRAWVVSPDSVLNDTVTNYLSYYVWSNNGVDTAFYLSGAVHAGMLQRSGKHAMIPVTTTTKKQFTAGEIGWCGPRNTGTITEVPAHLQFDILMRPIDNPKWVDSLYSR